MTGEPNRELSVGFDFDNPLGQYIDHPPATNATRIGLSFLLALDEGGDIDIVDEGKGTESRTSMYPLHDGVVAVRTEVENSDETMNGRLAVSRVLSFYIFDPSDHGVSRGFDIVEETRDDGNIYCWVEEWLPKTNDEYNATLSLFEEAVALNAESRLQEVPDSLPKRDDAGTILEGDLATAELFDAVTSATAEVSEDLSIDVASMSDEDLAQVHPDAMHVLSEKLALRAIEVVEPLIMGRLDRLD